MSDEEVYFDNDEEQENESQEAYEEDILDTPEKIFESASNSLGIDDYYAIDLFYKAYLDESSTEEIRKESIKNIAVAISQHPDDMERIINVFSDVLYAYKDNLLSYDEFTQTVLRMIGNLSSEGDCFAEFLKAVESQISINDNTSVYIEVKLRQCQILLMKGDIKNVENTLKEIESYISPSTDDAFLLSSYLKLLILKINVADEYHDEANMIKYFEQAKKISTFSQSSYQNAVFTRMEAIELKRNRKFSEAKSKFMDAFNLFDTIGSDKRIDCIKNAALCEMAFHGLGLIFNSSRISLYKDDENLSPILKMIDAYSKNDIASYIELIEPVSKTFNNNKFDIDLLHEIRKIVLRNSILKFSRYYYKFNLKFAAVQFLSNEEEVKELIMDLIITKDINALFNPADDVVTVIEQFKPSRLLLNTNSVLTSLEINISRITNEIVLDY